VFGYHSYDANILQVIYGSHIMFQNLPDPRPPADPHKTHTTQALTLAPPILHCTLKPAAILQASNMTAAHPPSRA
jgi:hypothetical protein